MRLGIPCAVWRCDTDTGTQHCSYFKLKYLIADIQVEALIEFLGDFFYVGHTCLLDRRHCGHPLFARHAADYEQCARHVVQLWVQDEDEREFRCGARGRSRRSHCAGRIVIVSARSARRNFRASSGNTAGPEAEARLRTPCVYSAGENVCAECLGVREKNSISKSTCNLLRGPKNISDPEAMARKLREVRRMRTPDGAVRSQFSQP